MTRRHRFLLTAILLFVAVSRLYDITNYPGAFGQDEIVVGYDAYCLLHTGRDHHGDFLPLMPRMFNDYLSGVQTYWTIPFVAVLGPTERAVRLACALPNVVAVLLLFLVARRLFKSVGVALWASFVMAIAPWHFYFSRWAVQPNFVPFFVLLFLWVFFKTMDCAKAVRGYVWAVVAGVVFVLLAQVYPAQMFFAPLLALVLGLMYLRRRFTRLLVMGGVVVLVMLPFIVARMHRPAAIARFYKETIIFDPDYLSLFWTRYTQYLSSSYLFEPLKLEFWQQLPGTAYFPAFFGPFFAMGLVALFLLIVVLPALSPKTLERWVSPSACGKLRGMDLLWWRRSAWIVLAWLFLSPVPAALFKQPEYTSRVMQLFPAVCLVIALGLAACAWLVLRVEARMVRWIVILVFIVVTGLHTRMVVRSMRGSNDYFKETMQFGLREVIEFLDHRPGVKDVYFTPLNQAYIYYLFYGRIDPRTLDMAEVSPAPPEHWEEWRYLSVPRVRNYHFNVGIDPARLQPPTILRHQIKDKHHVWFSLFEDSHHCWYVVRGQPDWVSPGNMPDPGSAKSHP